jgi:hypothetical protein
MSLRDLNFSRTHYRHGLFVERFQIPKASQPQPQIKIGVGEDGLVVPSWLALCWIALGSGFESQRGHLFFGISPRGEISQEGFVEGLVFPPATSRYRESVRIISEAPLVCPNGC